MNRASLCLVLLLTLALGVTIGLLLARPALPISAQSVPSSGDAAHQPVLPPPAVEDAHARLDEHYQQFATIDQLFSNVARTVAPAVVHIVALREEMDGDKPDEINRIEESGSGVIVRSDVRPELFVLTNNHVVQSARSDRIDITLHDGRVLHPVRYWADPKADVAVLQLDRADLPAARFGDSDRTPVGSWVLALGSPFGLSNSVTQGIISARNRHEAQLEDQGLENQEFLQTDAAINPGNSGGPLVNLKGEIIGINTAIASSGGGSEGVGFSIPANLARWILNQLVSQQHVTRGALGVRLQEMPSDLAERLGLDRPKGACILRVQNPSPAAEAGLRAGDVVLSVGPIEIIDINHLINVISRSPVGQVIDMTVWRDRSTITLRVTVADRDDLLTSAFEDTEEKKASDRQK